MAAEQAAMWMVFGFVFLWLLFMCLILLCTIFWVWMIIDCATRNMKDNDKVVWILVLIFLSWLGATVYYFVIKRNAKK
jgi:hypothetical protein